MVGNNLPPMPDAGANNSESRKLEKQLKKQQEMMQQMQQQMMQQQQQAPPLPRHHRGGHGGGSQQQMQPQSLAGLYRRSSSSSTTSQPRMLQPYAPLAPAGGYSSPMANINMGNTLEGDPLHLPKGEFSFLFIQQRVVARG